jgi:hypothetical protein
MYVLWSGGIALGGHYASRDKGGSMHSIESKLWFKLVNLVKKYFFIEIFDCYNVTTI